MTETGCRTDALTRDLALTLQTEYGVPSSEIDSGYEVSKLVDGRFVTALEGAGDGCLSFREVVSKAVEIVTDDAFSACSDSQALARTLSEDFGIKIPWLFYDKVDPNQIDYEAISDAVEIVDEIEGRMSGANFGDLSSAPIELLARTIFNEIMPFAQFRSGQVDPFFGVWRLHSAMRAAGIESSFVLVQNDPLGEHLHKHVALSIELDDGRRAVVDPAYEIFDLQGMNEIPIDTTQALSYLYYHRAISSEAPLPDLEMACALDESNIGFTISKSLAMSGMRNPLALERGFYWHSFFRAREILSGKSKAPQSPSDSSLDLVIRSMK